MPEMGEAGHFVAQKQHFKTFSKSVHQILPKFYLIDVNKYWVNATLLVFLENFFCSKWELGHFWAQRKQLPAFL